MKEYYSVNKFNIDLAKKVQNNEIDGIIMTVSSKDVRIVSYDVKDPYYIILALVCERGIEVPKKYNIYGKPEKEGMSCDDSLIILTHNYNEYKGGDIVKTDEYVFLFDKYIDKDNYKYCTFLVAVNKTGNVILPNKESSIMNIVNIENSALANYNDALSFVSSVKHSYSKEAINILNKYLKCDINDDYSFFKLM